MAEIPTTSSTPDRYEHAAEHFVSRVAAVPPDAWSNPSPCEGWTARDVVRHVVDAHQGVLGMAGETLDEVPSVDEDPVAAAQRTCDATLELLRDPARAAKSYTGMFGETTLQDTIRDFICFDLVIHGWDVAKATGGDEHIDDTDIEIIGAQAAALGDNLRRPGVCGPEVPVPADAAPQTRLLALLGRRA